MAKAYMDISMIEQMKKRISVRTYLEKPLAPELKTKIQEYSQDHVGPFGGKVRFQWIDRDAALQESKIKLGTYGVIKGVSSYIAAVIAKGDKDLEDFGYTLEKVILYAASLGCGTCWLGGTFSKGEFSKAIDQKEEEILPCITPIGYPSQKRSLVESAMRMAAGSKNRKSWNELFFDGDFGTPLTEAQADNYQTPLEMVRLAPSASNKQPWRIVKVKEQFHFFLQHTKGYAKLMAYDLQRVDLGIAMCHFELAAQELGLVGRWQISKPNGDTAKLVTPPETEYIVSWVENT